MPEVNNLYRNNLQWLYKNCKLILTNYYYINNQHSRTSDKQKTSPNSGHGGNPIFFNKKNLQIGRPEHLLTPHPPTPDNISFLP